MRGKLIILIAIISGILGVLLVWKYTEKIKQEADKFEYISVIAAKQNIPENTKITSDMLYRKQIIKDYKHKQEITESKEVLGYITLVPFTEGQSIYTSQIVKPGDYKAGLAYTIPEGKRALAIPINDVSGVAGKLRIGDIVDILCTIPIPTVEENFEGKLEEKDVAYTLEVLNDIQILDFGKATPINEEDVKTPTDAKTVVILVTPEQSLKVKLAVEKGIISLTLRSPIDKGTPKVEPFRIENFINPDK